MPRNSPLSPQALAAELVAAENAGALDLVAVFGRVAPLEVDLGCGDGTVLTALAAQHPERDFLGIEQLRGRTATGCRKIARLHLTNARMMRADISRAPADLLPRGAVTRFHLLFPDPWPKRRHHIRRVVTPEWLRAIAAALVPAGTIRMVTDDATYLGQMQHALAAVPELRATPDSMGEEEMPQSTFEQHFRSLGVPIHRLLAVKAG
ncbi:MAG: tRNA (guanosine(46)-N7)-methyltransferase TrmB [Verrucomicrobiota bacterium]|nr:tRNA (guanosine(46)-N7)-methyltransferase TrmB [Verrucomicrobiota bacterium]